MYPGRKVISSSLAVRNLVGRVFALGMAQNRRGQALDRISARRAEFFALPLWAIARAFEQITNPPEASRTSGRVLRSLRQGYGGQERCGKLRPHLARRLLSSIRLQHADLATTTRTAQPVSSEHSVSDLYRARPDHRVWIRGTMALFTGWSRTRGGFAGVKPNGTQDRMPLAVVDLSFPA